MELSTRKETLVKGLARSQSVAERRTSMPILSNVLLDAQNEKLTMTATDLETTLLGEYPATIKQPGKITVTARKFYEIIKELPSENIYLKKKENNFLHISAGQATFDLVGLSAEDYPEIPIFKELPKLTIPSNILIEMIEKTIFSISQEDTRFNLAGLYIQKYNKNNTQYLRFVSTDGHRLSLIDKEIPGLNTLILNQGIIIPRKGVTEIRKLAEEINQLTFMLNEKIAVINKNEVWLILRMQDGIFPDYNTVIPKNINYNAIINKQIFSSVLKRISLLVTDRFRGVRLNFKNNILEIISQNPDLGKAREILEIAFEGNSFSIGFNARYFLDLCNAMRSEQIKLSFIDEHNPCLITGEKDPDFLSIIMPMRI